MNMDLKHCSYTLLSHSYPLLSHSYPLPVPSHSYPLPSHSNPLPSHSYALLSHSYSMLSHSYPLPSHFSLLPTPHILPSPTLPPQKNFLKIICFILIKIATFFSNFFPPYFAKLNLLVPVLQSMVF